MQSLYTVYSMQFASKKLDRSSLFAIIDSSMKENALFMAILGWWRARAVAWETAYYTCIQNKS